MSLDAFNALFLTPLEFKEIVKRTFNLNFLPKELSAVIHDFKDDDGNVISKNFVTKFIQIGADERTKFKLIMLEKQRNQDKWRKEEQERKLRQVG